MRGVCCLLLPFLLVAFPFSDAGAASLRVAPLSLERTSPAVAGTFTLTNTGREPVRVQLRIFRWTQTRGVDTLTPTPDVVASPPAARLAPGAAQTIRVVRVARTPVRGEESYRLVVDELPVAGLKRRKTVKLLLRYSIPVFFAEADAEAPQVAWRVRYAGGRFEIAATNTGQARAKLSQVSLRDAGGATYTIADGLLGYVLAGATMKWSLPAAGRRAPQPGRAVLRLAGENGVSDVPVRLGAGGG
jgi:fimbrial chaperone protein